MIKYLKTDVDGSAANGNNTVEAVVLAAHWLGLASAASTDNVKGAALETDGDLDTLEDDTEKAQKSGNTCIIGGLNLVAALNSSSIALAISSVGSGKDGGEDKKFGEHCIVVIIRLDKGESARAGLLIYPFSRWNFVIVCVNSSWSAQADQEASQD